MGGMSEVVQEQKRDQQEQSWNDIISSVQNGGDPLQILYLLATNGLFKRTYSSPEFESWLQAVLSRYNTQSARDYETEMANSDFLRAASQLGALGMSPYNVSQTGASSTPNVSAASSPMLNNANQRYNRATSIANSLIGMAGRMASSGIYGGAIASVRNSASKAASMAAHSAPAMLNIQDYPQMSDQEIDALLDSFK